MNDNPTRASSTVTRRAALTGLGIAGLGLASGVASRQAAAQDAAGGPNLAGSWLAIITFADGRTIVGLSTYGTDGTAVASGLPAQPAPPGAPPGVVFASLGHGAWEATGPDTANVTVVHLRASAEGAPVGTLTGRFSVTLAADGQTYTGEIASVLTDPAGNTLGSFTGTLQATRIAAEAPGAAATPTA